MERMIRMVIDLEIIYYKDYSRKIGYLFWGRNVLNEIGSLIYILKEYFLEDVE